jgi:hypothetical protein
MARKNRSDGRTSRLSFECLEQRRLLTTFWVTNTLDAGDGSLRDAVEDADLAGGKDEIQF